MSVDEEPSEKIARLEEELAKARERIETCERIEKESTRRYNQLVRSRDETNEVFALHLEESFKISNDLKGCRAELKRSTELTEAERERATWFQKKTEEFEEKFREQGCVCDLSRIVTPSHPMCQICRFGFSEHPDKVPRTLECGHSVCHGCAQQLCQNSVIKCPFDRRETQVEFGSASILPKNFTVLEMVRGDVL